MLDGIYQGLNLLTMFLYVLGLVLLLIEAMFPGFGVAGTAGVILVIVSIIMISQNIIQGLLILICTAVFVALLLLVMIKIGWTKGFLKHFVLSTEQKNEEGYISYNKYTEYIGKKGTVITPLRSAGTAMFDGKKLDVISQGEFIDKDALVEVIKVDGSSIIVREIKQQ